MAVSRAKQSQGTSVRETLVTYPKLDPDFQIHNLIQPDPKMDPARSIIGSRSKDGSSQIQKGIQTDLKMDPDPKMDPDRSKMDPDRSGRQIQNLIQPDPKMIPGRAGNFFSNGGSHSATARSAINSSI